MNKMAIRRFFVFVWVIVIGVLVHGQAFANLMISPTRIVIEGRERYATVHLVNNGPVEKNYSLEFVHNRVLPETGVYARVESLEEGVFDLSEHLVFSPRRVRLRPGGKQTLRLALRRPAEIPPGDHRVSLRFSAMSVADLADEMDLEPLAEGQKSASLTFNISYSVPIFLREGVPDIQPVIGDIRFERNESSGLLDAYVPLSRVPAESPYGIIGYLYVYHIDESGQQELVGEHMNTHVFPEINSKTFRVLLTKDIASGSLRFVLRDWKKGSDVVYAEKTIQLAN